MGSVEVTIDVKQVKSDIKEMLNRKIKGVTTSTQTYDRVMGAVWEGMQMSRELPVESGALSTGYGEHSIGDKTYTDKQGRVHKRTAYTRVGNTYVTTHARQSKLTIDPYEIRGSHDEHYANRKEDKILMAKEASLEDLWVLSQIADIVGDKLRKS